MKSMRLCILSVIVAAAFSAHGQTPAAPTPAQLQQEIDALTRRVAMVETKVGVPAPADVPSGPTFRISAAGDVAPAAVHFDGTGMLPTGVAPEACDVLWTVTDPGGAYNVLHGFNAAHIFNGAGTFAIACTVTAPDGTKVTASRTVAVAADNRQPIYVDGVAGSDANAGTADAP